MPFLLILELASGIAALLFTAMAFTHLSWAEGGSDDAVKRASLARARRFFLVAAGLWAVCVLSYFALRWTAG